jgi:methyl-accepting chemotaxis protein
MEKQKLAQALEEIYQDTDQKVSYVIYATLPIIFIIGAIYGNPVLALFGISSLGALTYYTYYYIPTRVYRNFWLSVAAILSVAVVQLVMNGLTEAKYFYFSFLFLLTLYQSRTPVIIASVIAYTYIIFSFSAILTDSGFKSIAVRYFAEFQNVSLERFVATLLAITFANFIALTIAQILAKRTLNSLITKYEQENQLALFTQNIAFADEIAQGNYDFSYALNDKDEMGKSLLNMRDNLKAANERDIQERFITKGLSEIGEILRLKAQDLTELADSLLGKIIQELQAHQGAIYLLEGETMLDKHLKMIACYAYNRKKFLGHRIEIGEGMVGQCYLEKLPIYLTDIPKNYQQINSGLGLIPPAALFYVPMVANEKVVGVLEIAALKTLAEYERKFLERIAETMATTIVSVKINEETKKLYDQSRIANEELQAREEEMRQNMEELQATQEAMQAKQMEIEQKNQMLEINEKSLQKVLGQFKSQADTLAQREKDLLETKTNFQIMIDNIPRAIFWKDTELKFLGCNKIFATIAGLKSSTDIVGKTDYDMPWAKADSDAYRADDRYVIDNQHPKIDIEESQTNEQGITTWNLTTKVPLLDYTGNCFAVLGMFEDITERKQKQIGLQSQVQSLEGELQTLKNTLEKLKNENEELKKTN